MTTQPSERLRIMLNGSGADVAAVRVETSHGTIVSRTKDGAESGTDLVVSATDPASGVVSVVSADGGHPITGRLAMKLMSSQSAGTTTSAAKRTWEVRGLDAEGRTKLDVLRLTVDERHVWTVESLIDDVPLPLSDPTASRDQPAAPGATSRARVVWGDRERASHDISIVVDRSASMAWTYQPGGALEIVCDGVMAAAASALDATSSVRWWSYGSFREPKHQRILPAGGGNGAEVVASLKPELFSSGAQLDLDRLEELDCSDAVMVTDNVVQARGAAASDTAAPVKAVILMGAAADDELVPAEEQQAHIELRTAGVAVLPLPAEAGQRGDGDQIKQMYVDSVARFVLRHIESTSARGEG